MEPKFTNDIEEWKKDNPQAFDPTNDKSNKDNHGWRKDNKWHNPNNWDPKIYEETYPDLPFGESGIYVNSEEDDTLIHIVIPVKQWDKMWKLYKENE